MSGLREKIIKRHPHESGDLKEVDSRFRGNDRDCGNDRRVKNRTVPLFFNNKSGRVSLLKLVAIGALAIVFLCLGLRAGFKLGKSVKEAQASPSAGWLAGYGYQKAIVIDNTANASALTDYQVKVTNPIYDETGLVGSWHFEEGKAPIVAEDV